MRRERVLRIKYVRRRKGVRSTGERRRKGRKAKEEEGVIEWKMKRR